MNDAMASGKGLLRFIIYLLTGSRLRTGPSLASVEQTTSITGEHCCPENFVVNWLDLSVDELQQRSDVATGWKIEAFEGLSHSTASYLGPTRAIECQKREKRGGR